MRACVFVCVCALPEVNMVNPLTFKSSSSNRRLDL